MNYLFSEKFAALKPSAIREIFKSLSDPEIISFAAGNPAPESFPVAELQKLSTDIYAECPGSRDNLDLLEKMRDGVRDNDPQAILDALQCYSRRSRPAILAWLEAHK